MKNKLLLFLKWETYVLMAIGLVIGYVSSCSLTPSKIVEVEKQVIVEKVIEVEKKQEKEEINKNVKKRVLKKVVEKPDGTKETKEYIRYEKNELSQNETVQETSKEIQKEEIKVKEKTEEKGSSTLWIIGGIALFLIFGIPAL